MEFYYRYISENEYQDIISQDTPVLRGRKNSMGITNPLFYTPDYYSFATEAKSKLALRTTPKYRVKFKKVFVEHELLTAGGFTLIEPADDEVGGGLESTVVHSLPIPVESIEALD